MKTRKRKHNNVGKDGYKKYLRTIDAHKVILEERYKVKQIGIFGSYVRGEEGRRSDVDILVDFREIPDLLEFISLELYLEKILKKKVDLVDKQGIRRELRRRILGEVVYV